MKLFPTLKNVLKEIKFYFDETNENENTNMENINSMHGS